MRKKENNSAKYEYHFLSDEDKKELADKYGYEKPKHEDIPKKKKQNTIITVLSILLTGIIIAVARGFGLILGGIPTVLICAGLMFIGKKIIQKKDE